MRMNHSRSRSYLTLIFLVMALASVSSLRTVHASTRTPVYVVNLDAYSTGPKDTLIQTSHSNTGAFRVGVVINATAANPLANIFGWQFQINYDPTMFVPMADPDPASSYPDGAGQIVDFGTIWATYVSAGEAFAGTNNPSPGQIIIYFTLLQPTSPVTLSARTLLANVAFEPFGKTNVASAVFRLQQVAILDQRAQTVPYTILPGADINETVTNDPPRAAFDITQLSPSIFKFNATLSTDPDGIIPKPTGYFWDFGDGANDLGGSGPLVTHDYNTTATLLPNYQVTLRVVDNLGATGSARDATGRPITNDQPSHAARIVLPSLGPSASFAYSPTLPSVMEMVTFDASSSTDNYGTITSYCWRLPNFQQCGTSITYSFDLPGNYPVTLVVTDDLGRTDSITRTVTVPGVVAKFSSSTFIVQTGVPVSFDGSQSYSSASSIVSYQWDFGDGGSATGVIVVHTYATASPILPYYTVTLIVKDQLGSIGEARGTSTVLDRPPITTFTSNVTAALTGDSIFFNASQSFDVDGTIKSYDWTYGDGLRGTGVTVVHAYSRAGVYSVTLTATDDRGMTSTATVTLKILDRPPVGLFTESMTPAIRHQLIFFDASMSSDPDGNITSYVWTFGDGTSQTGKIVGHAYIKSGSYNVTLTVTDNDGKSSTFSKTVIVISRHGPHEWDPRPEITSLLESPNKYTMY